MNHHTPIPNIVETIKERHITPTPRWIIVGKRMLFWALLALFGGVAAIFLSLALVDLLDLGPDLFHSLGIRRFPFFFLGIPLIWTALFTAAILLGLFVFRKTKHGYRFRMLFVASLLALAAVTFAIIAHWTSFDDRLDRAVENGTPETFQKILPPREIRWMSPRDGILIGKILEIQSDSLILETPREEIWKVILTSATKRGRFVRFEANFPIIIIGIPKGTRAFEAVFIRPLRNNKNEKNIHANFSEPLPYKEMRGAHDKVIR